MKTRREKRAAIRAQMNADKSIDSIWIAECSVDGDDAGAFVGLAWVVVNGEPGGQVVAIPPAYAKGVDPVAFHTSGGKTIEEVRRDIGSTFEGMFGPNRPQKMQDMVVNLEHHDIGGDEDKLVLVLSGRPYLSIASGRHATGGGVQ